MRGGGINATTSCRTRDYRGGCKPSQDLAATALVLAAEAAAELIVDDANGSNSGVAIIGSMSLMAGGGVNN